jgi:hypothetical protein
MPGALPHTATGVNLMITVRFSPLLGEEISVFLNEKVFANTPTNFS